MALYPTLQGSDSEWLDLLVLSGHEDFITARVVKYSDAGSSSRYEAPFSVSYDVDISLVPEIVKKAVSTHKKVLKKPCPADCELRGFGDNGVEFAVGFGVNGLDDGGLDDGKNKFISNILFLIWNALKEHDIEIPYPQRVGHHKGLPQGYG